MVGAGGIVKGAGKLGIKGGWNLIAKFRMIMLFLIFSIMISNAVLLTVQNKSLEPGFKYIGSKWLNATHNLGEQSRVIINQKGIYDNSNGVVKGIWNVIKDLYGLIEAIFIIWIWLKVLSIIILQGIIWDSSKESVAFTLSVIFFLGIQMIIAKNTMIPIYDLIDFVKSLPYIMQPIADKTENMFKNG